ncbi:MAG: SDR family NAD(P)-dependent oxidoreductase [Desulfobacteraceae bacterium]|nr:SDR family NAD(P)-dependent oxidoreductase [Desulfobacteraceae bacterium]
MGKSILITGASSGIGYALSYEMARRGYSVGLAARRIEILEKMRDELPSLYPDQKFTAIQLDVAEYESVPAAMQKTVDELQGLDIVVANAGVARSENIGKGKFVNSARTIETNLTGAMATVDAAVSYFLEKGSGHIVGISSVAGLRGMPGSSAYSTSKAGLSLYFEALRAEVYFKNIDVTILHPGFIDTPLNNMLPTRPFLIPVEKGAKLIASMIEKKVKSSTVPVFPWNIFSFLIKLLPVNILARMK